MRLFSTVLFPTTGLKYALTAGLLVLAAACGDDDPANTKKPFEVVSTNPSDGTTNVSVQTTIDIEFNAALQAGSGFALPSAWFTFDPALEVPHTITKISETRAQVIFGRELPYGTLLTGVVQGVLDAENRSVYSYEFTFVTEPDTIPPDPPIPSELRVVTNRDSYFLTGNREPGSRILIAEAPNGKVNEDDFSPAEENTFGDPYDTLERFSVEIALAKETEYKFAILSEDRAGNRSRSVLITIIKDTTPPGNVSFLTTPTAVTNQAFATFKGPMDGADQILITHNEVNANASIFQESWTMTAHMVEGDNAFTFRLMDEAGNLGPTKSFHVFLDTTPPAISVDPVGASSATTAITVSGSLDATANLWIQNTAAGEVDTFSQTVYLPAGRRSKIVVSAMDSVGNRAQKIVYVNVYSHTAPDHLVSLPLTDSTAVGPVRPMYVFDQPLDHALTTGQIAGTLAVASTELKYGGHAVAINLATQPAPGSATLHAVFVPEDTFGQVTATPDRQDFDIAAGSAPATQAVPFLTEIDNRGAAWSVTWPAVSYAIGYAVKITQATLNGTELTHWKITNNTAVAYNGALAWQPVFATIYTVFNSGMDTTSTTATGIPSIGLVDLGSPVGTELIAAPFAFPAIPVTGTSGTDFLAGRPSLKTVHRLRATGAGAAGFAGMSTANISHASANSFGSAITASADTVWYAATNNAPPCIYKQPLVQSFVDTSLQASHELICSLSNDQLGSQLAWNKRDGSLITSAPSRGIGGTVLVLDPDTGDSLMTYEGYDAFVLAESFAEPGTAYAATLGLLQTSGGETTLTLWRGGSLIGSKSFVNSSGTAKAVAGDLDGDGYQDIALILNALTEVQIHVFSGGPGADVLVDTSITIDDNASCAAFATALDATGDGLDDIVCNGTIDAAQQGTIVLPGLWDFFRTQNRALASVGGASPTAGLATHYGAAAGTDFDGNGHPDLLLRLNTSGHPIAVIP